MDVKKPVEGDAGLRQVKMCNIFGISEKKIVMGTHGKGLSPTFRVWLLGKL